MSGAVAVDIKIKSSNNTSKKPNTKYLINNLCLHCDNSTLIPVRYRHMLRIIVVNSEIKYLNVFLMDTNYPLAKLCSVCVFWVLSKRLHMVRWAHAFIQTDSTGWMSFTGGLLDLLTKPVKNVYVSKSLKPNIQQCDQIIKTVNFSNFKVSLL